MPWTVISDWHSAGKYWPYSDDELVELLVWVKSRIHPWIRINRVRRDIPMQYVLGVSAAGAEDGAAEGGVPPNLRHDVTARMRSQGLRCECIRCREVGLAATPLAGSGPGVGDAPAGFAAPTLLERWYEASGGREVFLSYEMLPVENSGDTRASQRGALLCGFLRLRLPCRPTPETQGQVPCFPELAGAALVRELHVYGQLQPTAEAIAADAHVQNTAHKTQHSGIGRKLLERAEAIAVSQGWTKVAVISGVGARNYYRKFGYRLQDEDAHDGTRDLSSGGYMIKFLRSTPPASSHPCCSSIHLALASAVVATVAIAVQTRSSGVL